MTTVLAIVQEFCGLRGLPVPSALFGANDKNSVQWKAIVSSVVRDCLQYSWQQQHLTKTWTTSATASQGTLETLFGTGYIRLIPGTTWNTSRKIPVIGPLSDQEWAARQALALSGPPYVSWVGGNTLYLNPIPAAGESMLSVYQTKYGYAASGVAQETFTADSNTFLFPDIVMLKGIEYQWRKQKGEAYTDDYNDFMALIAKYKVAAGMPTLSLDGGPNSGMKPGIVIPVGSWMV